MNARTKSSGIRVTVLSAVVYAVTLAGCQAFQIGPDMEPGAFVSAWKGEKALLRDECIVQKGKRTELESAGLGSLLLTVAPTVIDKSIEAFSAYLEKKKDALTAVTEYKTAGLLYVEDSDGNFRPSFDCLILVKGKFGPTAIPDKSQDVACPPTDSTTELWDVCRLHEELSLQAPPDFYAEFGVVSANEGTSIAFVPLFVDYTVSAADPGKGSKDLLFAITLTAQFRGKSEVQTKTFAAFTLKLSEVRIGSRLDSRNALLKLTTQYQSLPQTSTVPLENGYSFTDLIPIEVLAVVTETEEGGDFYVKAAEVLKEIKKPLSEQATEWLKEILSSKDQSPSK